MSVKFATPEYEKPAEGGEQQSAGPALMSGVSVVDESACVTNCVSPAVAS